MVLKNVRGPSALIAVAALSIGCGSGLSTEEATQRCDQERISKTFFTEASYAQCLECYEQCGDECTALARSPEQ
jgi:hypothetical protein